VQPIYLLCNASAYGIQIRHSIVASIPACHAGDQGSIPCVGAFLYLCILLLMFMISWFAQSSNNSSTHSDNIGMTR
jgi:hypothetical protein